MNESDESEQAPWDVRLACATVFLIIIGAIVLMWRGQTLGHERRLRTIEGCQTITEAVAKADCYTGDVWE